MAHQNGAPSSMEQNGGVSNGNVSLKKENGLENPVGVKEIVSDETKF